MRLSTKPVSLIISLIIGGIIGYLGGPAIVLVPWAVVGLAIGAFSISKKAAYWNGAIYGFVLAYVFMVSGYNGQQSVSTKLLPFIIFGIVGAICGTLLALIAYLAKHHIKHSQ